MKKKSVWIPELQKSKKINLKFIVTNVMKKKKLLNYFYFYTIKSWKWTYSGT